MLTGNDYGRTSISPNVAYAGEKGEWEIHYTAGERGIVEGGSIRIIGPFCHDAWLFGKVTAFCDNPDIYLEVLEENTRPVTYHHSNYQAFTVVVYGSDLAAGECIRVVLGAKGGYVSGRFMQTTAQTHADDVEFKVLVDPKGNGRFCRERHREAAYQPCAGSLEVCVKPSRASRIRCTVRNGPGGDRDLIGVVSVEDGFENPISAERFDIALDVANGQLEVPAHVHKARSRAGARFAVRGPAADSGVAWVSAASWQQGLYGVSNPICPGFSSNGYRLYFGDLHVMTGSGGNPHMCGSTESALKYARDVFGLDFTSVTNSFPGERWPEEQRLFREYNRDHEFVTIPGYELGWRTGHKNVYYLDESLPVRRTPTLEQLWEFLADKECLVVPHHTNTHSETDRELCWGPHDLGTINPAFERHIEVSQNRGSFEKDEIGGEVSFGGFGSSVRDALARGLRLGFVGGTDTHRARPGSPLSNQSGLDARAHVTGGITAVLCPELTRQAVWDALNARRCYTTTSVRILLDFSLNGRLMGEDVRVTDQNAADFAERALTVRAAGTYPLDEVVIVRNGEEVFSEKVEGMETRVAWRDEADLADVRDNGVGGVYYYAKVRQRDGNMAWASPVWLTF